MELKFAFPSDYGTIIHIIFEASWVAISEGLENMIYELLHAGGGICRIEAHYSGRIKSSGRFKGHQVFCFLSIPYISITVAEIEPTEEYSIAHPFDNGVNTGERKDIFNHDSVNFPIIEYWPKTSILFFDVEDRCQVWGF